jgi:WD40 repeat protein
MKKNNHVQWVFNKKIIFNIHFIFFNLMMGSFGFAQEVQKVQDLKEAQDKSLIHQQVVNTINYFPDYNQYNELMSIEDFTPRHDSNARFFSQAKDIFSVNHHVVSFFSPDEILELLRYFSKIKSKILNKQSQPQNEKPYSSQTVWTKYLARGVRNAMLDSVLLKPFQLQLKVEKPKNDMNWTECRAKFSTSGKFILEISKYGIGRVFDVTTSKQISKINYFYRYVDCMDLSPDDKYLVIGGHTSNWDFTGDEATGGFIELRELSGETKFELEGISRNCHSAEYSPRGDSILALLTKYFSEVMIVRPHLKIEDPEFRKMINIPNNAPISLAKYTLDGENIIMTSNGSILIFKSSNGEIERIIKDAHSGRISDLNFFKGNKFLKSFVTSNSEGEMKKWILRNEQIEGQSEEPLWTQNIGANRVSGIFSKGNLIFSLRSDRGTSVDVSDMEIRDASKGELLKLLKLPIGGFNQNFNQVVFSPDGQKMLISTEMGNFYLIHLDYFGERKQLIKSKCISQPLCLIQ